MREFLESQEFYDLMQSYRIAPTTEQDRVIKAFDNVKAAISSRLDAQVEHANCEHPRERRVYVGEGYLRCTICNKEFR